MSGAAPTPFEAAMGRLRDVRDALNGLDLDGAMRRLAEHDAALRSDFAASGAASFPVVEAETLARAQAELLAQLEAVRRGVIDDLGQARRGGEAARAYLAARGD